MYCNIIMIVYTDGSSIYKCDGSRVGGLGIWFGRNDKRNVSMPIMHPNPTNQVSELIAIKYALILCQYCQDLTIKSDSQYSINCITKWSQKWKSNGWKNSKGAEVSNMDIIKEILNLVEIRTSNNRQIQFIHVYGHSGEEGNEEADSLANRASRLQLQF